MSRIFNMVASPHDFHVLIKSLRKFDSTNLCFHINSQLKSILLIRLSSVECRVSRVPVFHKSKHLSTQTIEIFCYLIKRQTFVEKKLRPYTEDKITKNK